ncbi:MAG: hypothetical protein EBZ17_03745, partial [Actinobacteria bacterium]|nr:hypothetical protein [Actinomycetota bacterium]
PLFDAVDTVRLTLLALDGMISTTTFNTEAMAAQAASPYAAATDLAEWLVARGMPFRDAHAVVGEKVRRALAGEGSLGELRHRVLRAPRAAPIAGLGTRDSRRRRRRRAPAPRNERRSAGADPPSADRPCECRDRPRPARPSNPRCRFPQKLLGGQHRQGWHRRRRVRRAGPRSAAWCGTARVCVRGRRGRRARSR